MRYITEFREQALAQKLAARIAQTVEPHRTYRLMEFCGGHTHAISRYGLRDILPPNVQFVHGPGCPVCVLPIGRIDQAITLALRPNIILCAYADTLRIPASSGMSLLKAKAQGADVRMVYSTDDVLRIAQNHPGSEVVFLAIGFETTTPQTAVLLLAAQKGLPNLSILCNHVLTPPAMAHIMELGLKEGGVAIDGFIGPSHVSAIIGSTPYEAFVAKYQKPVVIAGFEPLDVLQSTLMLIEDLNTGTPRVQNEFRRVVTPEGNRKAQNLVGEVFTLRPSFQWRGLGAVPYSALAIAPAFAAWDAERRYALADQAVPDHKACQCARVLQGRLEPQGCKAFGTACTPEHPLGACMVSSEGACAAHYTYHAAQSPSSFSAS